MLSAPSSCFVPGLGVGVSSGVISGERTRQIPAMGGGGHCPRPVR